MNHQIKQYVYFSEKLSFTTSKGNCFYLFNEMQEYREVQNVQFADSLELTQGH